MRIAIRIFFSLCCWVIAPSNGFGVDDFHLPQWNGVCGGGRDLVAGCAPIRARAIADVSLEPWRQVGRVNLSDHRQRSHCTGTLIRERHVLTTARCVFNERIKRFYRPVDIFFEAGYDRGQAAGRSRVARYLISQRYRDHRDAGGDRTLVDDWAILELEKPVGQETGFVETETKSFDLKAVSDATLAGYAALRAHVLTLHQGCALEIKPEIHPGFAHTCVGMQGDSGAPLFAKDRTGGFAMVGLNTGVTFIDGELVFTALPLSAINWRHFREWSKSE